MSFTSADGRAFFDTNVLVYAYDALAGGKRDRAHALAAAFWDGRGTLSLQVLQELYVTLTQKLRSPLEPSVASGIVGDLTTWMVYAPASADVLAAISLHREHGLSFWDAMIVHAALQTGCAVLYSEDLQHGRRFGGLEIVNPFADRQEQT